MHDAARRVCKVVLAGVVSLGVLAGCQAPPAAQQYPPGALQVRYESASGYAGCLTASVAMAANYVLGEYRFSEKQIRHEIQQAGLDETRVGDMKAVLNRLGLHLITLAGEMDGKPPLGLRYWVLKRGFPAICVINTHGLDPGFNHAVVVIGFCRTKGTQSTDSIYYLDPSAVEPLHTVESAEFERTWARGGHAMMVVVRPPAPQGGQAE